MIPMSRTAITAQQQAAFQVEISHKNAVCSSNRRSTPRYGSFSDTLALGAQRSLGRFVVGLLTDFGHELNVTHSAVGVDHHDGSGQ